MKFDKVFEDLTKQETEQDTPYIELSQGELLLDVEGTKVRVVFQRSGEIDVFDIKGDVYDSDAPHFQHIVDFATSIGD